MRAESKVERRTPANNHLWDKQLNFQETYDLLLGDLRSNKYSKDKDGGEMARRKLSILLIALVNGSRRHEAIEAYNKFVRTGQREVGIAVGKRGWKFVWETNAQGQRVYKFFVDKHGIKRKKPIQIDAWQKKWYRTMIIPKEVSRAGKYDKTDENLWEWADRHYGFNPHSMRYTFITETGQKMPPQIVASITGQKTINMILEYTQEQSARKALKEFVTKRSASG